MQTYNSENITTRGSKPPILKPGPSFAGLPIWTSFGGENPTTAFQGDRAPLSIEKSPIHFSRELKTPRLNNIHQHLWLAGRPTAARPLHRQKLLGRTIFVTEDPDEHLVWFEHQIFIKPLPVFLLDWESWNGHLCSNADVYKAACGMLLSYAWLVRYRSDLEIAKETGLLPKEMEWPSWVQFIDAFLANINCEALSDVNQRYQYGELRLSRLNAIYRFLPPKYSLLNLTRGYQSRSMWYQAFFDRHFRWMLAVFAALSIVLSALQVGLATAALQDNRPFQRVAYGLTVTSLATVAASLAVVFLVWLSLFCYYFMVTWSNDRAAKRRRSTAKSV